MQKKILACLLSLFVGANAFAEEKEKRYRIELMLFQKGSTYSESFLDRGEPDLSNALPYVSLSPTKLVLSNAQRQLAKQYTPILHDAWLQTLGTKTEPTAVRVVGGKKLEDGKYEVKGILKIIPGRQLFIDADLAITNGLQTARFETIAPVTQDELNFIPYANFVMIVMVGPAVTPRI